MLKTGLSADRFLCLIGVACQSVCIVILRAVTTAVFYRLFLIDSGVAEPVT